MMDTIKGIEGESERVYTDFGTRDDRRETMDKWTLWMMIHDRHDDNAHNSDARKKGSAYMCGPSILCGPQHQLVLIPSLSRIYLLDVIRPTINDVVLGSRCSHRRAHNKRLCTARLHERVESRVLANCQALLCI